MNSLFRLLLVSSILGSPIWAQENAPGASVGAQDAAIAGLEDKLLKTKSLYRQGERSYSEALTAEAELLQLKSASGTKNAEIQKRLQEIYSEQIRLAQERGSREDALEFQIKLLEVSADADSKEDVLNCYKQLIDCKKEKYNRGAGSYVDVLRAEISFLKAALPGQSPDRAKEMEKEIQQKQDALKQLLAACS